MFPSKSEHRLAAKVASRLQAIKLVPYLLPLTSTSLLCDGRELSTADLHVPGLHNQGTMPCGQAAIPHPGRPCLMITVAS